MHSYQFAHSDEVLSFFCFFFFENFLSRIFMSVLFFLLPFLSFAAMICKVIRLSSLPFYFLMSRKKFISLNFSLISCILPILSSLSQVIFPANFVTLASGLIIQSFSNFAPYCYYNYTNLVARSLFVSHCPPASLL
jgi:hypothetical protein